MKSRSLFKNPILWIASSGLATIIVVACSSSSTPAGGTTATCSGTDKVACVCADGTPSEATCNDPSSCACGQTPGDSGPLTEPDSGHGGDGGHVDDGASPAALYSSCAKQGSFGYPCTVPNGNDPANCTDPNFPYCFGGGQGYWCTAFCGTPDGGGDAGDDSGADAGMIGFAACLIEEPDGGYLDAATSPNQGCGPIACNAKGYCK